MSRFKGRRGLGLSVWIGVFFFFAVVTFLIISRNERVINKDAGYIGGISLDLINARYEGEKALFFIDYSAKYSLQYALVKAGEGGAVSGGSCGEYVAPVWVSNVSSCAPQFKESVQGPFDVRLQGYLSQYSGIPLHAYTYQVDATDSSVVVKGFSAEDLVIPLTTNGQTVEATMAEYSGGLVFPVEGAPVVSSCYGNRLVSGKDDWHAGMDFSLPTEGSPIHAIAPGTVLSVCEEWVGACDCSTFPGAANKCGPGCAGKCGNYGNTVVVKHGDHLYSRYSHLKSVQVKAGDKVNGSQVIALSGNTGFSEAPHLDFRIYTSAEVTGNRSKDPLCFYADEQLAGWKASGQSCRDGEVNGGVFKKENVMEDCKRIDPLALQEVARLGKEAAVPDETAVETVGSLPAGDRDRINAFQQAISDSSEKYGVDENLIKAVMTQESHGDPRAGSSAGAQGLMQIMPLHYEECVKECGFSSSQDFWDGEKNICCGTYILKMNYRLKPKKYPQKGDSCCVNINGAEVCKGKEYVGWEAAIRGYNGWGCSSTADPIYVDRVLKYYYAWGGETIGESVMYASQMASYRVRPNFKASVVYNASVYDELFGFVNESILPGWNLLQNVSNVSLNVSEKHSRVEGFLQEKMAEWNLSHPGKVLKRYGEDTALVTDLGEQYADCLLSNQSGCVCVVQVNWSLVKETTALLWYADMVRERERLVSLPGVWPLFGRDQKALSVAILSLDLLRKSANFQDVEGDVLYLKKELNGSVSLTRNWGGPVCQFEKEYYSLCLEDSSISVPMFEEGIVKNKPVRIHFSVYLGS